MSEHIDLLRDLVSIDSQNPDLVPGAVGEAKIAHYIAEWAEKHGLEVHLQDAAPGRPNVIVIALGSGGGQSLMLNGHLDTVTVAGMDEDGHTPRIEGGRMYGRGTYDMKSGLTACLLAAKRAKGMNLRGDVIVSGVADEEYASIGADALVREWSRWPADAVIVTEPTEMEICIAHKGFVWLEVTTEGVAAHGSRPYLGVDAIAHMGRVLAAIEALDNAKRTESAHPLLKFGSLHASTITGGQGWSAYPAGCTLQVERRTLPGETSAQVQAELQAILDQLAADDPQFKARVETKFTRSPFEVAPETPIVQTLQSAAGSVLGTPPPLVGNTFWMDAAVFAEAGIPTAVFGPLGEGAHAAVEWVDLDTVARCADVLTATAQAFCG